MEKEQLKHEIRSMRQEKNAVILAHYYTEPDLQDIADFVGDSLALAQSAAKTEADIIVMCGVHFMGETCKILCPDKKVIVPDLAAGCSLADRRPQGIYRPTPWLQGGELCEHHCRGEGTERCGGDKFERTPCGR